MTRLSWRSLLLIRIMLESPCLKLKVYVKPANGSGYESPEPFLTDKSAHGPLGSRRGAAGLRTGSAFA
ncbi:hypothetical protein SRHO_G00209650 [Serrasalmus rhombeus]